MKDYLLLLAGPQPSGDSDRLSVFWAKQEMEKSHEMQRGRGKVDSVQKVLHVVPLCSPVETPVEIDEGNLGGHHGMPARTRFHSYY